MHRALQFLVAGGRPYHCTGWGIHMIKLNIKSLFKRKELIGRGIKLLFLVSSCVSENNQKTFKISLQNSLLKNYFSSVDITYYECEDNSMWFKVFCPEAIFTVKSEDIVPAYRYIFDNAFSFVKSLVNECGYKLQRYSFEFVYRMFAEEPQKKDLFSITNTIWI
jgi:hypothetical protein